MQLRHIDNEGVVWAGHLCNKFQGRTGEQFTVSEFSSASCVYRYYYC